MSNHITSTTSRGRCVPQRSHMPVQWVQYCFSLGLGWGCGDNWQAVPVTQATQWVEGVRLRLKPVCWEKTSGKKPNSFLIAQLSVWFSFSSHDMWRNHLWIPYALVRKNSVLNQSSHHPSKFCVQSRKKKNLLQYQTKVALPPTTSQLQGRSVVGGEESSDVTTLLFRSAPWDLRWLQEALVLEAHLNQKMEEQFIRLFFFFPNLPCWLQRSGQCWRYGCSFPQWQGYLKHKWTGLGPHSSTPPLSAIKELRRNAWIWFEAASYSPSIKDFEVTCAQMIKED